MNLNLIILIVVSVIILYLLVPQVKSETKIEKLTGTKIEKLTGIDESAETTDELKKLDQNKCSKHCCKHTQWAVPHDVQPTDEYENYVGSNLSCNFGAGSGCLCVTKKDMHYMSSRGSNAGQNMCSN